jgi:putative SbcD/Mre11-related phosphoesterase
MNLEFVGDGPALLVINSQRVLAVADLHLGIESDLAQHGLHFPSRSKDRLERLERCIDDTDPDLLLILGDIKHAIPFTTRQEYQEIPDIVRKLRVLVPLRVVPGNHDAGIERFFLLDEILPREGVVVDGTGYVHGHMYPDNSLAGRLIVAGHHHPLVSLRDEVGCALRSPAYVFAPLDEGCLGFGRKGTLHGGTTRILFMPAFNELSGYDLLRTIREPFSPLSRCMRTELAEVFLPDGTYIGPLSALEEYGADPEP